MTLTTLLTTIHEHDDDLTVYARRQQGAFTPASEAALLALTDAEHDMDIDDIADRKCPGFEYFMELFMIKEMADEMRGDPAYDTPEKAAARVIRFQEEDE